LNPQIFRREAFVIPVHLSLYTLMKSKIVPLLMLATLPVCAMAINLLSPEQEAKMGKEEFIKYKASHKAIQNGPEFEMTQRVAARLLPIVKVENAEWEFVLFEDASPNAFALPGGKVGVHSGLFKIVENEAQLAAVIGHELGHVKARHSGERISNAVVGSAIGAAAGKVLEKKSGMKGGTAQAVTQGAATLRLLKFSREQELEADRLGAIYMAKAGYDPEEAVKLWKRFDAYKKQQGGGKTPAFLSTHPLDSKRIEKLESEMPEVKKSYKPKSTSSSSPIQEEPVKAIRVPK
tara:strand:- start:17615 stop:18490 length:876 start_codon:yes stop_codon:yes gene_type:complete